MVTRSNALSHIARSVDGNKLVANGFIRLSIVLQLFDERVKLVELFLVDWPGAGLDRACALDNSLLTAKGSLRGIVGALIVPNKQLNGRQ